MKHQMKGTLMTNCGPNKYDVVGSFLRPAKLKEAREAFAAGTLDATALKVVEDECITDLIAKEKTAGLRFITDGEFRRATWHLDFMWAFDGIGHAATKDGLPFHDEAAKIDDTFLTGKVVLTTEHPFVEHYRFVAQFEDEQTAAKLTIPAPAQFIEQFIMPMNREATEAHYADDVALEDDIVAAYGQFISQLYAAGCRNLQFDDCSWGCLVDPKAEMFFGTDQAGLARIKEQLLRINNRVLDAAPAHLRINTHVCRGNYPQHVGLPRAATTRVARRRCWQMSTWTPSSWSSTTSAPAASQPLASTWPSRQAGGARPHHHEVAPRLEDKASRHRPHPRSSEVCAA